MDKRKYAFIMRELRKASLKWPPRNIAKKEANVARGRYLCNICKKDFHYKEIHLDHKEPVVNPDRWDGWEALLDRLFCLQDGFQVLCKECHDVKTQEENKRRPKKDGS